jgi:hypothetical protein
MSRGELGRLGPPPAPPSAPGRWDELDELKGRVLALEAICTELRRTLGRSAADDDGPSGLLGAVECLQVTLGEAPNEATGDRGSGLCRVLAEIARDHRQQTRNTAKAMVAGSAGAIAVGQVVLELLRAAGWLP